MAILRRANAIATFCLICITTSSVFAWVLQHPLQTITKTQITSPRFGQNVACHLNAHETGRAGAVEETTAVDNIKSWDDQVIHWVDGILEQKSEQSPFVSESLLASDDSVVVPYEWIEAPATENTKEVRNIALRTNGNEPLLDAESISKIREAAERLWERQSVSKESSSRFTLQYKDTNSECHLDELVAEDESGELKKIIETLLLKKVYPLVRSAFEKDDRYALTNGSLCVYDSLVVRYNGDKASDRFGASQPLHGDGGVVSVNIALNSHCDQEKDEEDTFSGGGTFFEDLLESKDPILRPSSTGHALAHWSTHRHAGAPTRSGTRDILVIFLTQKKSLQKDFNGIERSFQLKLKARELEQRSMALRCLDLAIEKSPFDAQAHFWKGFNLIQGKGDEGWLARWKELCYGAHHLETARACAPFDAKISCYAGMAYRQRWMFSQKHDTNLYQDDVDNAANCLERALSLHEHYCNHGISSDFGDNANTARITLAEVYLQQEQYNKASGFLSSTLAEEPSLSESMKQHVSKLIAECNQQLDKIK